MSDRTDEYTFYITTTCNASMFVPMWEIPPCETWRCRYWRRYRMSPLGRAEYRLGEFRREAGYRLDLAYRVLRGEDID